MSEKPILFSGPMVRAILEGRKTQTRRVVKPQPPSGEWGEPQGPGPWWAWEYPEGRHLTVDVRCPYGAHGGLLWVREAHALVDGPCWSSLPKTAGPDGRWCYYREGFDRTEPRWRPSIHMPRWASRLTLRVEAVRVERLQSIKVADVLAEGVALDGSRGALDQWADLWDSINGKRAPWAANPWVWVVTFGRVEVTP